MFPITIMPGAATVLFFASLLTGRPAYVPFRVLPTIPVRAPLPGEKPAGECVIAVTSFAPDSPAALFTPGGKEVCKFAVGAAASPINPGEKAVCALLSGRLSSDGKRLAALKLGPIEAKNTGPWTPMHLWLFDVDSKDGPEEALLSHIYSPSMTWSNDGTRLYGSYVDPKKALDPREKGSRLR